MEPAVAIGGLGGSGTRIVVEVLQSQNYFMGNDLIESLDNLHFTRLLKNPDFQATASKDEINERIHILLKLSRKENCKVRSNTGKGSKDWENLFWILLLQKWLRT